MWQLTIQDPSGETRIVSIHRASKLGASASCEIQLRDGTLPAIAASIWPRAESSGASPFWIRIETPGLHATLADIAFRETHFPSQIPLVLGETRIELIKDLEGYVIPEQPRGLRHWHTCSEDGKNVLWTTRKAATTPLAVYLAGETGTGKELLAHLVHAWSPRVGGPFVPINCGALSASLIESELFGHVKGAFTGADRHRKGALLQAHGGTLFLDEIGDLSTEMQVKLLRFLEDGEIRPVGADHSFHADVRVVCATHKPLEALVETNRFRRDLYYRIASVRVAIPPVRERPEDVALLANRFAKEFSRNLSPGAVLRLQAHHWLGNVRELRHAIERAIGIAGAFRSILCEEDFEFLLQQKGLMKSPNMEIGEAILSLREMERHMLLKALRVARGNRSDAAKILGIARSTLFEMLKRHRIPGPKTVYDPERVLTHTLQ